MGDIKGELNNLIVQTRNEWDDLNKTYPNTLYHYTDINAFSSIVDKEAFWATHIKYLNDKKELTHALEITETVIASLKFQYTRYPDVSSFLDDVLKALNTYDSAFNLYVISLSEEGDLLSQWRGYGKKYKSICIGIDPQQTLHQSDENPACMNFFVRVIYDHVQQQQLVTDYLQNVCSILQKHPKNTWPEDLVTVQSLALLNLLSRFKHESWSEEKEWRLVLIPEVYDKNMEFLYFIEPKFRVGEKTLIPYLEHKIFKNGLTGITEITLPQSDAFDSAKRAIEMLVLKKITPPPTIRESRIPIIY